MSRSRFTYDVLVLFKDGSRNNFGTFGSKKKAEIQMRDIRKTLVHNNAEGDIILHIQETNKSLEDRLYSHLTGPIMFSGDPRAKKGPFAK